MADATLLVIQGPDQGNRIELVGNSMSIGRGVHNEIRIIDTEMSRQHARLTREKRSWRIADLNSSNGTFVNGKLIDATLLQPGDQIQLGRTILLFAARNDEQLSQASSRINLIPEQARDDRSRIVGQARSEGVGGHWGQAGTNLQLLYQITEEVGRPTASRDELLRRILDLTLQTVGADRGCMLVTDSKTDRIEPRVVSHRPGIDVDERMPISTTIVEYVIQNGQGVRTSDAQHDSRFDTGQSILKAGIREVMCVPMQGRYELMGVIYVDTTNSPMQFSNPHRTQFNDQALRLMLAIGRQSALAIENYRYQESMLHAERLAAVGQTVAILSHHIKNILQGIRGGGYLVEMGLKDENLSLVRKGWGIVERNQERIYNLVMDMLTYSKERVPKLELTCIRSVIQDVAELMQQRLADRGIELKISVDDSVPASMIDPEGFHRAILNLLINAIDALEDRPEPRIEMTCRFDSEGDQFILDVRDNGSGIDPVDLPKLFHLFESSKGSAGTGLGLTVSKKVLQEHGGDISVESELDTGTCFHLHWPYVQEEPHDSDFSGHTREFDIPAFGDGI